MIQGEIKRINRILEDILFVARPLKLNVSPESIPEIIDSVLQRCQPQIDASHVTTVSQHQAELPPLQVDRQRLEQVFTNLVLNATQAMAEGGEIRMETYLHKNGTDSPESIVISVADDGPGIPDDIRRRVFEPFFTTKTRGTGLGLTVAHRIIEEHHGSIRLNDAVERGTNFIIELPLKRDTSL